MAELLKVGESKYPSVLVLNNDTINAAGQSKDIFIGDAEHVDVLIVVGGLVGTAAGLQFELQVVEKTTGEVIYTYKGTALSSAPVTDYITVDRLTLGDTIRIAWTGTLSTSNYFTGVTVSVVAKP